MKVQRCVVRLSHAFPFFMFERRECAPNLRVSKLFIQHVQLPSVVMEYFCTHCSNRH